jgi:hypothetical protein
MITERYRKDYIGEFVITGATWSGGKKRVQREWIVNPIQNHHISGRAACIGTAVDRDRFDYRMLQNHRGGLLGTKKLQTYGVGEIAHEMRLDFAVEKDEDVLFQMIETEYYKQNTIYTSPKYCLEHPGVFYNIPYNPVMLDVCLLPYLAAFDGHQEIFLIGYSINAGIGRSDWADQIKQVMDTYSSVKFYHIGNESDMPEVWKNNVNVSNLSYREFIAYADI